MTLLNYTQGTNDSVNVDTYGDGVSSTGSDSKVPDVPTNSEIPSGWDIGEFEDDLELDDLELDDPVAYSKMIDIELTHAYEHDARIWLLLRKLINCGLWVALQVIGDFVSYHLFG